MSFAEIYIKLFLILLFIMSQGGCSGIKIPGSKGTTHHVIIGFGVVSVNDNPECVRV